MMYGNLLRRGTQILEISIRITQDVKGGDEYHSINTENSAWNVKSKLQYDC